MKLIENMWQTIRAIYSGIRGYLPLPHSPFPVTYSAGKLGMNHLKLIMLAVLLGHMAESVAIDTAGWTCTGTCGTSGANGVVTLSPAANSTYGWVSTANGVNGLGLAGIGGTNGSLIRSSSFLATAGQQLSFYFNYVTTDGSDYTDYAWVRLLDAGGKEVALLFTARTTSGGNTVPGKSMPTPASTLKPSSTPIIAGVPSWSPLGADSGECFDTGCGYTGWVQANYTVPALGSYVLEFGVVNWNDENYQSGIAFDGATIGGKPITPTLLTVTRSGSGSGAVTSSPAGIDCGATCSASLSGSATLTATPASGSTFAGWSGDCTGTGSCVVAMSAAKSVTATFKQAPFAAATTTSITATSATIATHITFNAPDVGKTGAVFITAWVPVNGLGTFGILTAHLNQTMSVTATNDNPYPGGEVNSRQETLGALLAATDPTTSVLVQLTPSGWQLVQNGQLAPYTTGVLGDSLASMNILNNTNPANLLGSQFCVGYGTSAAEMIAAGRMQPVAIIPDATGNAAANGSCNVANVVVEFYNTNLDNYFITADAGEAAQVDNGMAGLEPHRQHLQVGRHHLCLPFLRQLLARPELAFLYGQSGGMPGAEGPANPRRRSAQAHREELDFREPGFRVDAADRWRGQRHLSRRHRAGVPRLQQRLCAGRRFQPPHHRQPDGDPAGGKQGLEQRGRGDVRASISRQICLMDGRFPCRPISALYCESRYSPVSAFDECRN